MKKKYVFVFLGMVLCLFQTDVLNAQYCLSFDYDDNGNRIERLLGNDCDDKEEFDNMRNTITSVCDIEECVVEDVLQVFPNPTNGYLTLQMNVIGGNKAASLSIYNMNGVKLVDCQMINKRHVLDISSFPRGVYLMKVESDSEVHTKMVLKL